MYIPGSIVYIEYIKCYTYARLKSIYTYNISKKYINFKILIYQIVNKIKLSHKNQIELKFYKSQKGKKSNKKKNSNGAKQTDYSMLQF